MHPGEIEPGPPGGSRYLCPLCDWYLDVPAPEVPDVRDFGTGRYIVARYVPMETVEAALREHFTSDHTAPIVLDRS